MTDHHLYAKEQDYSANFTSNAFLHFEMKETAVLLDSGLSIDEAKDKILEENIFNYVYRTGILKKITVLKRRFKNINETLIKIMVQDSHQSSTIVALYSIYLSERLIREFMDEIVLDKVTIPDALLAPSDMQLFLTEKAGLNSRVASWKDSTRKKLWSVTRRMLMECNIIDRNGKLIKQIIPQKLKEQILNNCDYKFIKCIEGMMQ